MSATEQGLNISGAGLSRGGGQTEFIVRLKNGQYAVQFVRNVCLCRCNPVPDAEATRFRTALFAEQQAKKFGLSRDQFDIEPVPHENN